MLSLALLFLLQAPQTAAPSFDVASVKPAEVGGRGPIRVKFGVEPNRFTSENEALGDVILWAYDLALYQFPGYAASPSNPKTLDARYVISGTTEKEVAPDMMRQMVQQLLAQRFGLKTHMETKSVEGYNLVLLPGASFKKLDQPAPPTPLSMVGSPLRSNQTCTEYIAVRGNTFRALAQQLTRFATKGKPVIDQTGLEGAYNVDLSFMVDGCVPTNPDWTPPVPANPDAPPSPMSHLGTAPPLEKALKAMGLGLEPGTVQVQYLTIDNLGELIPD